MCKAYEVDVDHIKRKDGDELKVSYIPRINN